MQISQSLVRLGNASRASSTTTVNVLAKEVDSALQPSERWRVHGKSGANARKLLTKRKQNDAKCHIRQRTISSAAERTLTELAGECATHDNRTDQVTEFPVHPSWF